ncbi:MAG: 2-dehydropantoate 2-reductase [Bacteroidetes bacterium]|nr:MAG: 2-dehydropantoate 2-reductase [Bacteroidota bacterium]
MSGNKNIKIGIIGLGPVGSVLAVKLREAGCQVALCELNEVKRNKIRNEGLTLQNAITASARFDEVYATASEMAGLDLDYLFFAIKSYHLPVALQAAAALNSEKLRAVSAQNGIDVEDALADTFGESKTLRMVINFAGAVVNPNTVKVNFFQPPNYVGSINDACTDSARQLADLLNSVQLETHVANAFEIQKRSWEKTILNASLSALCGVGRLTMAEAMNDPDTIELIEQIIAEAILVAESEKIRFQDDFVRQCMRYLKKGGDHFPSLALDLINNRPTEIDFFNGKIVAYGRKHYIRTSLNLSFTNMVKAMTNKNIVSRIPGTVPEVNKKILEKGLAGKNIVPAAYKNAACFLGVDLGSAYTKFMVVDETGKPLFRYSLPTLSNDKLAQKNVMRTIASNFNIHQSCATGYGRRHFTETDMVKTEINCAAAGVSHFFPGEKNIIDIGGEDIKIIHCNQNNGVENFYMNDKCAAGTGAFLAEIAERARISLPEMSNLAAHSDFDQLLNSFCTVFAKTEIMNWIFEGMSPEDIARGIYLSIAGKVAKMRLDPAIPTFMIGGVAAHHPYLRTMLSERFDQDIRIVDLPQYTVAFGAAILARDLYLRTRSQEPDEQQPAVEPQAKEAV